MKIKILFLGKTKEKYLSAGISDYHKRLSRYVKVEIKTIKENRGSGNNVKQILLEGKRLLDSAGPKSFIVALDPKGKELSSKSFATLMDKWEQQSTREVTYLIGGPLGLSDEVKEKSDLILSLSQMTFTHEMARLLLVEQLYRAFSIKAGSKYHK